MTVERAEVDAAAHTPPAAPAWRDSSRTARAGAPLYLLVEPAADLAPDTAGRLEAALEAAGLLDAWMTPEGRVLDHDVLDAAVVTGEPAPGRTLADVLVPTPTGGVRSELVRALLARVGLVDDGAEPDTGQDTWVSVDGRFGIGTLRGAARRDEVAYLGETARAQTRARRLAALDARLGQITGEIERLDAALTATTQRRDALEAELAAFPPATPVLRTAAEASAAARAAAQAAGQRDQAATRHAEVVEALEQAAAERDEVARAVGLSAHVDRLDDLATATHRWARTVDAWLSGAQRVLDAVELLRDRRAQAAAAAARAEASATEVEDWARRWAAADERVAALRSLVGADHQQVVADLTAARQRSASLEERAAALVNERIAAEKASAVADKELEVAAAEHTRLDAERAAAADAVRSLADLGVLQVVTGRELDDPASWGIRTTLDQAREAARHGPRITSDEQATALVEDTQNTLARRQQELTRDLVAGIRLFGRTDHGVVVHDVQYGGRTFRLPGLVAELREDVAERDQRLAADEQGLLEQFLAGELHEHLRSRIRDAGDLVDAMNERLAACPTASGQRVRLRWEVDEDAPAGSRQAVDLLLRGAGLLTDDQRGELRAFLHDRLRQAREGDAAASLQERIAGAFDYRAWHAFRIEVRDAATPTWRRLTRQSHATGSGGEKAVMLHLPLFAAMAAHYRACPSAPRLIVLDEVFAGIDRGTRGQLMGLLVELDLDALLTSHEEWGFYAELDGLSTYHLVRDADVPGVLTEWFVWDGARRWELS